MAKSREPVNPFYVLLVLLGIVFLVTACAYGVMAYRAISPVAAQQAEPHPLTEFLDEHGVKLLGGELALLALASFAAMGLDRWRDARRPLDTCGNSHTQTNSRPGSKTQ
ncbi:MAG: hypothetical protein WD845_03995 [Pirellulales bacterium]